MREGHLGWQRLANTLWPEAKATAAPFLDHLRLSLGSLFTVDKTQIGHYYLRLNSSVVISLPTSMRHGLNSS